MAVMAALRMASLRDCFNWLSAGKARVASFPYCCKAVITSTASIRSSRAAIYAVTLSAGVAWITFN